MARRRVLPASIVVDSSLFDGDGFFIVNYSYLERQQKILWNDNLFGFVIINKTI